MQSSIPILMANFPDIIIDSFNQAGQGQVFQFFDELDETMQAKLVAQAENIDLAEVKELVDEHVKGSQLHSLNLDGLEPAPIKRSRPRVVTLPNGTMLGMRADALRAGRVAAFTVAGGQGTPRLRWPKGYPVTPVTQKTLFQVFAEKIARSGERFDVAIHMVYSDQ